jgi:hypothetical protein
LEVGAQGRSQLFGRGFRHDFGPDLVPLGRLSFAESFSYSSGPSRVLPPLRVGALRS